MHIHRGRRNQLDYHCRRIGINNILCDAPLAHEPWMTTTTVIKTFAVQHSNQIEIARCTGRLTIQRLPDCRRTIVESAGIPAFASRTADPTTTQPVVDIFGSRRARLRARSCKFWHAFGPRLTARGRTVVAVLLLATAIAWLGSPCNTAFSPSASTSDAVFWLRASGVIHWRDWNGLH